MTAECGAVYGHAEGLEPPRAVTCRRPVGHPPISEDGIGHSPIAWSVPKVHSVAEMHAAEVASFLRRATNTFLEVTEAKPADEAVACDPIGRDDRISLTVSLAEADRLAYALLALAEIREALRGMDQT